MEDVVDAPDAKDGCLGGKKNNNKKTAAFSAWHNTVLLGQHHTLEPQSCVE